MKLNRMRRGWPRFGERGFTFTEVIVALTLFASVSLFMMQVFVAGMAHAGRSNESAAASTLAVQVMEQIQASANPYMAVGFTDLPRSSLPLPAPYSGVTNASVHPLEVAVSRTPNDDLTLATVTVSVFRPGEAAATATLTAVLDDQ